MKKWIAICMVALLCCNIGFAGQVPEGEIDQSQIDSRLQLIYAFDQGPEPGFHMGGVDYLAKGNLVQHVIYGENSYLYQYDQSGNRVGEVMEPGSSYNTPTFVIQAGDNKIYTTNGVNLLQTDSMMEKFTDLGESFLNPGEYRTTKTEIGFREGRFGNFENEIRFLNYTESGNPVDFENNLDLSLQKEEIQACMPEGIEYFRVCGFDYGATAENLYLLIEVSNSKESVDYYVLEALKTIKQGPEITYIALERVDWIRLDVPEFSALNSMVATKNGFEVALIGMPESRMKRPSGVLCRFSQSGQLVDSIQIPGEFMYFDANGKQSAVVSWYGPEGSNALYMINWNPSSAGMPKSLIAERTFDGKTIAKFRDNGYGLLKTKVEETGLVDYLAPLKTEEPDVRLQIPLQDLLAKQGEFSRNLVILFGEDRISIPMSQLDCAELLAAMPCQDEATIEIRLNRLEDGSVKVTAELFVVEQVDEMTKRVHRVKIEL